MGIRAAVAERVYGSQALAISIWRPLATSCVDIDRAVGKVDVLVALCILDGGRHLSMLHAHQDFDHAQHACCSRRVTNVRLERTDSAEAFLSRELAEGVVKGVNLDRIAKLGARAMRFDVLNVFHVDLVLAVDRFLQLALREEARRGDAGGLAVLVGAAASDDAVDVVVVPLGIAEALENQDPDAVAYNDAVRSIVKRTALSIRRQHPGVVHGDERARMAVDRDSACDGEVDLPALQLLAGQVDRHHRRGAGRVHRQRRPFRSR